MVFNPASPPRFASKSSGSPPAAAIAFVPADGEPLIFTRYAVLDVPTAALTPTEPGLIPFSVFSSDARSAALIPLASASVSPRTPFESGYPSQKLVVELGTTIVWTRPSSVSFVPSTLSSVGLDTPVSVTT